MEYGFSESVNIDGTGWNQNIFNIIHHPIMLKQSLIL